MSDANNFLHSLGTPGYRTTVVLFVDFVWRGDVYSLLGILLYWLSVLIPAVMTTMSPFYKRIALEVLWLDLCLCLYCFSRPLHEQPFSVLNLWLWIEVCTLFGTILGMIATAVTVEVMTKTLLYGTVWGNALAQWWYLVVAEVHRNKAEFHANMQRMQ